MTNKTIPSYTIPILFTREEAERTARQIAREYPLVECKVSEVHRYDQHGKPTPDAPTHYTISFWIDDHCICVVESEPGWLRLRRFLEAANHES